LGVFKKTLEAALIFSAINEHRISLGKMCFTDTVGSFRVFIVALQSYVCYVKYIAKWAVIIRLVRTLLFCLDNGMVRLCKHPFLSTNHLSIRSTSDPLGNDIILLKLILYTIYTD
jgi:hypothetical protein